MIRSHFPLGFIRRSFLISSLVVSLLLLASSFVAYRFFFSGKNLSANQNLPTPEAVNLTNGVVPPKEPKVTEVSNLYTYDPQKRMGVGPLLNYDLNEPSFSIKLPDGWILREPNSPASRVLTNSPSADLNSLEGRAVLGVNFIKSQESVLTTAIKAEKEEISKAGKDHYFFADKVTKLNGQEIYLLEYKIKLEVATESEQPWDHHVDIFLIRNGYLIDLYASTREKDWGRFVETIQKSINTFELLTG